MPDNPDLFVTLYLVADWCSDNGPMAAVFTSEQAADADELEQTSNHESHGCTFAFARMEPAVSVAELQALIDAARAGRPAPRGCQECGNLILGPSWEENGVITHVDCGSVGIYLRNQVEEV